MRIASFNLESLATVSKSGVPLASRAEILRPQLERLDADILCLQEVNAEHVPGASDRHLVALDRLLAGTPYAAYNRAATGAKRGTGAADVHNLVILSRYPIKAHRELRHHSVKPFEYRRVTAVPPDTADLSIEFERPILQAQIEVAPGLLMWVCNVHLRAPIAAHIPGQKKSAFVWRSVRGWAEGYYLSAVKRAAQAFELRLAVDEIFAADPHSLIAVCGDFNAEDHESPLKIVAGAEEDTGNGELAALSLVILDRSLPQDRRFSVLHHGRAQMLDHILVSRPLLGHFAALEVHNESLGDEVVGYGKVKQSPSSYHAPVVAEFSLA